MNMTTDNLTERTKQLEAWRAQRARAAGLSRATGLAVSATDDDVYFAMLEVEPALPLRPDIERLTCTLDLEDALCRLVWHYRTPEGTAAMPAQSCEYHGDAVRQTRWIEALRRVADLPPIIQRLEVTVTAGRMAVWDARFVALRHVAETGPQAVDPAMRDAALQA